MIGKVLSFIIIALVFVVLIFFLPSCGTTRVVVKNGTETAATTISVSTNNPTSVTADPSVSVDVSGNTAGLNPSN